MPFDDIEDFLVIMQCERDLKEQEQRRANRGSRG